MNAKTFKELVLRFMSNLVIEHEEYSGDSITINMTDCNAKIDGFDWEEVLKEYMSQNYHEINISYGDGHWVTVTKSK